MQPSLLYIMYLLRDAPNWRQNWARTDRKERLVKVLKTIIHLKLPNNERKVKRWLRKVERLRSSRYVVTVTQRHHVTLNDFPKWNSPQGPPILLKTYTFLYDRAFCPQETCESVHRNYIFLKPLSKVVSFRSDGVGEFVWTIETGYFKVNYVINPGPVLNENLQVQNGG